MVKLPVWVSRIGLITHLAVGAALTALFFGLGASPFVTYVAVLAAAFAHELGDGDLTVANGAPWNGLLDILAFLPAPLFFLLWQIL